jgi:hypothetical protein
MSQTSHTITSVVATVHKSSNGFEEWVLSKESEPKLLICPPRNKIKIDYLEDV